MSLRENIQRHSATTTAVTVVVIIVALIFTVRQFANSRSAGAAATMAYFSSDDGTTWFADDIQKLPPFVNGGKEAVQAHVFRCGNDKPYIAYLERYTPEGKKTLEDAFAKAKADNTPPPNEDFITGVRYRHGEIKKPGESAWVNEARNPAAYAASMKLSCPGGTMDDLQMVMP